MGKRNTHTHEAAALGLGARARARQRREGLGEESVGGRMHREKEGGRARGVRDTCAARPIGTGSPSRRSGDGKGPRVEAG